MPKLIIQLNPERLRALVVGGGTVGQRKAKHLLQCGASVRLVALEAQPADFLDANLQWLHESYSERHLEGVQLVVAAANPEVHRRLHADAQQRGIWVCDASSPELGSVTFPAVRQAGSVSIAVSTDGQAPGAARVLADQLIEHVDKATLQWLEILSRIRHILLTSWNDTAARRELLLDLARLYWVDQIRQRGCDAVWQEWLQRIQHPTG